MRLAWVIALAACGGNRHTKPRDETLRFVVDGLERVVILHVPGHAGKAPLVFNLHGSGSGAAGQKAAAHMDELADREGFVVAYAQAAIPYGDGFQWHIRGVPLFDGSPEPDGPDDVAFIAQAIRVIGGVTDIDPRRIYVTGFSGGARMASQLGCDLASIAAIAPVAGVRYPERCVRNDQSVIAFHGTADATNPYEGNGSPYWTYSVPRAMQGWAANDGCAMTPARTRPAPTVELATFEGCHHGAQVQLYTLEGEGHAAPHAVDANRLMWDAFLTHALP
jgi:polyhydroxybutyrate depolymerase